MISLFLFMFAIVKYDQIQVSMTCLIHTYAIPTLYLIPDFGRNKSTCQPKIRKIGISYL